MSSQPQDPPDVYPGTGVLINLFGARTPEELDKRERRATLRARINYLHPFRDGNGRAQRAFLDEVAAVSGRELAWRIVPTPIHHEASRRSFGEASGKAFEPLFECMLQPPHNGLAVLDAGAYTTFPANVLAPEMMSPRYQQMMDPEGPQP